MTSELEDLEHAVDVANKVSFAGLTPAAKGEALAAVSRVRSKLDALDASVLTAFEATKEHAVEGHSSPVGWLKHHLRARGPDAARRRRVARMLKAMPAAHRALAEGQITVEHVEVLHRAQELVGDEAYGLAEEPLVDAAVEQCFADFARTVEYFVARARPRDAEERARRQFEDQYGSSSRFLDGSVKVDALFEPVGGTTWQAELDRLMDHLLEVDRAEARDRLGRRPLASELRRTARQRRAAAMILMAERSAAFTGELGPSRFTLVVHADTDLVAKLLAAVLDGNQDGEDDLEDLELGADSLHELDDGTVVMVNTVLLALLTGTVRGVLFDPDGEILRYGRQRRLFSGPQAQAVLARFRRCTHPYGCDRTAPRVQTDHITEYEDGGRTDTDNATPLCGPHNLWKTNHKANPPPPSGTPPDHAQRRLPPDIGPCR